MANGALTVRDVMERDLSSMSEDTTLLEAMALLAAHRTTGLPVLDDEARVVGFISEKDVLRAAIPGYVGQMDENFILPSIDKIRARVKAVGSSAVSEYMTKTPILFEESENLSNALVAIFKRNIHRAPVVREGTLVGIVSRESVLNGFIRDDITAVDEEF